MDFTTFTGALSWVITHSYIPMSAGMLIGGPIVVSAAAFAVALGYYNIYMVFLVALLTDLVADVGYYGIGHFGRLTLINRIGHYFRLSDERVKNIEELIEKHGGKMLLVLKLTPILPAPGLMMVGALHMPIKKYVTYVLLIAFPKTLFFMFIGYYFGSLYSTINEYIAGGGIILLIVIIIIAFVYYIYLRVTKKMLQKIEKI